MMEDSLRAKGMAEADVRGATHSELIVNVPAWSDGTPVADARKP